MLSRLTRGRNEHQRRAPDCVFFSIAPGISTKTSRTAKGRPSKASRVSIQSNATTHAIDDLLDDDDSALTNMTINSTTSKTTKKTVKGKKPKNRAKEAPPPEPESPDLDNVDMGEPEDAGFDVVIPAAPASKLKKGKKRMSVEMESSSQINIGSQEVESEPPPKRRATRARSSTVITELVPVTEVARKDSNEVVDLSEKEDPAMEKPVRSKKGTKVTRKRASSTVRKASSTSTRKASNTSTASRATLRMTGPTDEELDAALAADLDRPLTDEEIEEETIVEPKGKTRRLTRTKPSSRTTSRTVSASKALIQKSARASTKCEEDKLRPEMLKLNRNGLEEEVDVSSHEVPPINVKSKKGRKVAKAVKPKSLKKIREISTTKNVVLEDEQPAPAVVDSPTHSTTMLHYDIEAEVSLEVPPIVNEEHSTQAGGVNARTSAGSTDRKRSISDVAFDAEEKPAKGRRAEIKVEIQRLPSHSEHPIEVLNDDSVASAVDDEKDGRTKKAALPKKQTVRKAKGKTSKAKAVIAPRPKQSSAEPTPKQATPIAATTATAPKNIQIYSPIVVVHVDKQAAAVETKTSTPHEKAITPAPSPSPQSSDAENHPPSTRLVKKRPPLAQISPSKARTARIPLAASTPAKSPSKRNVAAKIQTDVHWTAIDIEKVFGAIDAPENGLDLAVLSSPEKKMTVKEWILHNAAQAEERLKKECERMVAAFELESVEALRALEGIVCID